MNTTRAATDFRYWLKYQADVSKLTPEEVNSFFNDWATTVRKD